MRRLVITVDPQPTLTATSIRYPNGHIECYGRKLATSKRGKSRQICGWLNNNPERISDHFDSIFFGVTEYIYEGQTLGEAISVDFVIEGQFKSKATMGLETFMKGWASVYFPCETRVRSIRAMDWQKVLESKPEERKDYAAETYLEMMMNDDVHIYLDDEFITGKRVHDITDTYLMLKWYDSGLNKKF